MSLIKLKDIGFGLNGKTLDITIAIPTDSYLKNFYVANQNDMVGSCPSEEGIDYIEKVKALNQEISDKEIFLKIFTKLDTETDIKTGNVYDVYQIKPDFIWEAFIDTDGQPKGKTGVTVSQKDITFIEMKVEGVAVSESFTPSTECGEDSTTLTVPLFTLTHLRLSAINSFKRGEDCTLNREFIDKILQIKAIEIAICCRQYCDAAKFWKLFWDKKGVKQSKKCGCHGGVA